MIAALRPWSSQDGRTGNRLLLWCPGCDLTEPGYTGLHSIEVEPTAQPPVWQWDGNLACPTVSPSIRVHGLVRCHSFVRAGRWEFLGDCEHALAGQTVPLPDLPAWVL